MIDVSLLGPFVSGLAARFSTRTVMITGALLGAAGYLALGLAQTITQNLLAYGLLVGPGTVLLSLILPSELVTRWFEAERGRVLGIVNMPLLVVIAPPAVVFLLRSRGLETVYFGMASVMLLIVPLLFGVVERPVAAPDGGDVASGVTTAGSRVGNAELLQSSRFWMLCVASAAVAVGGTMLITHILPMAEGWGIDPIRAAFLVQVMGGSSAVGSLIGGWIADKLGGGRSVALICAVQVPLWSLLLGAPPYGLLVLLVALIGIAGGGLVAAFALALGEQFGALNFGRSYGLSNLARLPILVGAPPLTGYLYARNGNYSDAIIVQILFFLLGVVVMLAMFRSARRSLQRSA